MKFLAVVPALALSAGLTGCCGMTLPNFPHAASAPAPKPVVVAAAPAPAPVAAPAPVVMDGDKDGVPDVADRCPASPMGSAVNAVGCPKGEKVTIALRVEFDTSKWIVKPEYDEQLKKVSDFLKTYPEAKAEIEGHTDNMGSADSNKALSQRRADAVRQALIDRFGADGARLTAAGYGPDRPLTGNDTAAGRAQNRRVVATFTGIKE